MYRRHLEDSELASPGMHKQWKTLCYSVSEKSTTAAELYPNTKYIFKTRRLGWSPWGAPVVIRSGPGVPSQPLSLAAKEIAATSVMITWFLPEKVVSLIN